MKQVLLITLLLGIVFTSWGQSSWEVVKGPAQPLIYSRDHVYFLDTNEGWLVGTISSKSVILHTTDGGGTWEVLMNSDTLGASLYDVFFVNSTTGWVVGSKGTILKTSDGGASWEVQTNDTITSKTLKGVFALNENIVYIAGADSTILKTTDGGNTWTAVLSPKDPKTKSPDFVDVYAFDENHVMVVSTSTGGEVFYSSDGGANWNVTFAPFPAGISTRLYVCTGEPGGTAYLGGYTGNVFKSTDYGATWEHLATIYGQDIYTQPYAIDMLDPDHVWVGGSNGKVFYSGDGGANWTEIQLPTTSKVHGIKAESADAFLTFATYGHFFYTDDGGNTFVPKNGWPNVSFWALEAPRPNTLMVGTISGGELTVTEDAGQSWAYPSNPDTTYLNGIEDITFVTDSIGFIVGLGGTILKTTDGGQSWRYIPNDQFYPGSTFRFKKIMFKDDLNGIAFGSKNVVAKTTDGGETWVCDTLGFKNTIYDGIFLDDTTTILIASSGEIYKTTDDGTTWTQVVDLGTKTLRSIQFINDTTGYICASSGVIYKTTDRGDTWTEHLTLENVNSPNDAPDLYSMVFTSSDVGWICGEDGAMYKTTDGGETWTQVDVPEEVKSWNIHRMLWIDENLGVAVAQNGYILAYGLETGVDSKPLISSTYLLNQNYPNPFNPTTNISFNIPQASHVKLVVYNTLGQVVRTLVDQQMAPGLHTVVWDGRNDFGFASPSGVYFYRLEAGNQTLVKKMLLVK